jgi:hypothetical protein
LFDYDLRCLVDDMYSLHRRSASSTICALLNADKLNVSSMPLLGFIPWMYLLLALVCIILGLNIYKFCLKLKSEIKIIRNFPTSI